MPRKLIPGDPAWTETVAAAQDALGNSVRLSILRQMTANNVPHTRKELADALDFSPGTIEQSVEVLKKHGLLQPDSTLTSTGRAAVVYQLNDDRLQELTDALIGYVSGQ